jgi:hypothetical protein
MYTLDAEVSELINAETPEHAICDLAELQLSLVGGGTGDISLG